MKREPGPYLSIDLGSGRNAPYYALRFDKGGRSAGPLTQQHLVGQLARAAEPVTDVYLFSHGWNNDWTTALNRYREFMTTYRRVRAERGLDADRPYRPVLAGVHWPSSVLVMPWEQGPEFAGDEADAAADAADDAQLQSIAEALDTELLPRFYELAERQSLDEKEATELLTIVSGVFAGGDPDVTADPGRDVGDLLAGWAQLEARLAVAGLPAAPDDFGAVGAAPAGGPMAAGFLDKLNPRNLVRGLTVYQMKDRAGTVGANGVGPLLRDMQAATADRGTRYHLVGHSYGARVLLAALMQTSRPVDSLLLLQPAVNHLLFADRLPTGRPGGFRPVLERVRNPIMTTFSVHDFALHDAFHLALRRGRDLGEAEIAGDEPPSEYAALGGYGPRGFAGWREVAIKDPGDPYDLGPQAPEVWAVNGSRTIGGHGDVVNASTAWALACLARA